MEDLYFKMIGLKTGGNRMILAMVVPDNFCGEDTPEIFEVQAIKLAPSIYSGSYPNIRILPPSVENTTEKQRGAGLAGIMMGTDWYNKVHEKDDHMGISLDKSQVVGSDK